MVDTNKENLFASIVAASFSQRRKTLRNTLQNYLKPKDFDILQIESKIKS